MPRLPERSLHPSDDGGVRLSSKPRLIPPHLDPPDAGTEHPIRLLKISQFTRDRAHDLGSNWQVWIVVGGQICFPIARSNFLEHVVEVSLSWPYLPSPPVTVSLPRRPTIEFAISEPITTLDPLNLQRFRSGVLKAILTIKETVYDSDIQRRVYSGCSSHRLDQRSDTASGCV